MEVVDEITVEPFTRPLDVVRHVLDGADEARLGVTFVQQRGVNLVSPQPVPGRVGAIRVQRGRA